MAICATCCASLPRSSAEPALFPFLEGTVTAAINQLRTEFLPVADADARWLAEIARTHQTALESTEDLPDLARFFDTHLALCYRNGEEWYDVHPLISEHVASQSGELPRRGKRNESVP